MSEDLFTIEPGESYPFQLKAGDRLRVHNQIGATVTLKIKGKISGTQVEFTLLPGAQAQITVGTEELDITQSDLRGAPIPLTLVK